MFQNKRKIYPSALLQADADCSHEEHVVGVREFEGSELGTERVAAGRRLEIAEDVGVDGTPETQHHSSVEKETHTYNKIQ